MQSSLNLFSFYVCENVDTSHGSLSVSNMYFKKKDICKKVLINQFFFYIGVFYRSLSSNKLIKSSKIFMNVMWSWKISLRNLPVIWKPIDLNQIETYKPFFILNNLIQLDGKFRRLLKDIISEPIFLIFSYLTLRNALGNLMRVKLNFMLNKMNVKWFLNISKKLKSGNFTWSDNRRIDIPKKKSGFRFLNISLLQEKIVQQAIYIVLNQIYENKLKYFSEKSYGFRTNKSCYVVLRKIKFEWHNVNWCIKFDIKKVFNFVNRNKLVNQLKKKIQDQNLFSLLFSMFKVNTWFKNRVTRGYDNFVVMQNNILSTFFLNIYLTPLDFYVKDLADQCNKATKFKKNSKSIKAVTHSKNKIKNLSQSEIQLEKIKLRHLSKGIFKKINDQDMICIKYLRNGDVFIIGVLAKKKLALKLKSQVLMWIESNLCFDVNEEQTTLTNVYNDAFRFLGIKIHCVKTKHFFISKSTAIEKKLRIMNRIKIRKDIVKNRISKNIADLIWNKYRKKPIKLLAFVKNLDKCKNKDFEFEIIEMLKLQRIQKVRSLAKKILEFKKDTLNLDAGIKLIFKNLTNIEKILSNLKIVKKEIIEKVKMFTRSLNNKFIVNQIKTKYSEMLDIISCDSTYLCDWINHCKFRLKWPKKIMKSLNICDKILFKAKKQGTKEKKLYIIINYLEKNQFKICSNDEVIEKIPFYKKKIVSQVSKTTQLNIRSIILTDLDNICQKLRENVILKPNKMKVSSRFKMLLCEDHEIISQFKTIALGLLNYYQYCNDFYSVKSIINYFVRQSLILTLKHKHKLSSSKAIYKKYGNRIEVKNSLRPNKVICFLSHHEIDSWKIRFKINDKNIIPSTSFESMFKIYLSLNNSSILKIICDIPGCSSWKNAF